jgi:glycosyltransferase involved in cell wall biosynthesis
MRTILTVFLRAKDARFNVVSNLFYVLNKNRYDFKLVLIGNASELDQIHSEIQNQYPSIEVYEICLGNGGLFSKSKLSLKLAFSNTKKVYSSNREEMVCIFIGQASFFLPLIVNNARWDCWGSKIVFWLVELPLKYRGASLLKRFLLGKGEKILLKKADYLILSNSERADFVRNENLGNRSTRFCVIHNFPELKTFTDIYNEERITQAKRETAFLCLTGLLDKKRCPEAFLIAATEIFSQFNLKLVLAGWTDNLTKKRIEYYSHISEGIKYLGVVNREELLAIQNEAIAGIALYFSNNMNNVLCAPQKIYEYLVLGKPVITSNNPPLQNLVGVNKLGVLISNSSSKSIFDAVKEMIANRCMYEKNVENWRIRNLNLDTIENEFSELLRFLRTSRKYANNGGEK